MAVTPRKNEIAAIVEVLEDDSHESAEKMAREVLKATYSLMLERDWYIVGIRNKGGGNLLWGPLPTEGEADRTLEAALTDGDLGLGGEVGIFPVRSVTKRREVMKDLDKPAKKTCTCGHPEAAHGFPKKPGCALKKCNCTAFIDNH